MKSALKSIFALIFIVHVVNNITLDQSEFGAEGSPAQSYGTLSIPINGVNTNLYVVSWPNQSPNQLRVVGNSVRQSNQTGFYLMKTAPPNGKYDTSTFYNLYLMNKTISYTLDIANTGCNCVAAVYLISAPGYNQNNQFYPGNDGTFYCDANFVNGNWCPEMDLS